MKIDKSKLLRALKADLNAAQQLKSSIDAKIQEWRSAYEGKPYGNETKGKSAIVSRDVKRQSEWQHASLVDPFVSTAEIVQCSPVTWEDAAAARQNQLLLNTQFCRQFDRFNFMSKAIKLMDMEGTLIVQTGWDYEDEEVEVEVEAVGIDEEGNKIIITEIVTETVVTKNQPTAIICRNEDIYLDPTCQDDINKAQFVIHRYETNLSTLRKDPRYKNLDKLEKSRAEYDGDYEPEDESRFTFSDEPRKKFLVHEYWGNYDMDGDGIAEPIVCAWSGDTIIRCETNPYPDKKPPFLVVPFNSVPFKLHGEANAELIGDGQKVKTAIVRGILDNMARSNNGQIGIHKQALDATNRARFLQGKSFEYNTSRDDIWQGSYNSIPGSVFNILSYMDNTIESLSGVKGFSGGIGGASLGSSATAARGILDATTVRRMHIVRNIAENLVKPLLRKWMAYNAEFLGDEEVVRVTSDEFVPVRRDDLSGKIDIEITVSTAEDNEAKAQELSFSLQTLGPSEDPAVRREILATIFDLMRMPEKAKLIRDYNPEPDPLMLEAQQLEIEKLRNENLLVQARIAEQQARTQEAQFDMQLKAARAEVEKARARKLDSESDALDLNFLMTDEDVEGKRKLEEFERKRLHDLDVLAFQAQYGDSQLGVSRK